METLTQSIAIERVDRDCPYNDRLRGERDTRNLIRDFKVLIDGEHRATFKKVTVGRGYELYDADHRPIGAGYYKHIGYSVGTQSEFLKTVDHFLESAEIPTLARMAELREIDAAEKLRKQAARAEARRIHHIQSTGVELYNALSELLRCSAIPESWAVPARAVIAKAETVPTFDEEAA
jgi:hypothetical protein